MTETKFNINLGQYLLANMTKLTHLQSQTNPPQYQMKKNLLKNTKDRERNQNGNGRTDRRTATQRKFLNGGYTVIPSTF